MWSWRANRKSKASIASSHNVLDHHPSFLLSTYFAQRDLDVHESTIAFSVQYILAPLSLI